jgi:type I restriction enzyme M protein
LKEFNKSALDDVGGDVLGRIYEYFLGKFAKSVASDDGVFFTPKSLVKMIVNIIEPKKGVLLDPACGSGGMFVQTGDFINQTGMAANNLITFYGQEKAEFNAQLCAMNMAVHGLTGTIKSGNDANTYYIDAHSLEGKCDYVMANPPFNVDKVNSENTLSAGRLPFGLPGVNKKKKEVSNANYLWISYFYSYLKDNGRSGFVMASSATDSQGKDKDIRQQLVETGDVDVIISVANNFFYTVSLPCTLWFFNKGKDISLQDKVLFLDARNYYTVIDRKTNEWSDWQLKNLNAIVWLYRGQTAKYQSLLTEYRDVFKEYAEQSDDDELKDALKPDKSFSEIITAVSTYLESQRNVAKEAVETADRKEKKKVKAIWDDKISWIEEIITVAKEAEWLYSKFGDGTYADVLGLCKIADRSEIAEKGYSLTPGAYVGVAEEEDDGVNFNERMKEIHDELASLQEESNQLMNTILQNIKEMGI